MNIKAEHLKLKRTVINKLLWIAPFLTALLCALSYQKEISSGKYYSVLSMLVNLKKLELFGVFECLQCILYSKIELRGPFRYIPFAWQVNWIEDVFSDRLSVNCVEWFLIMILTGGILIMVLWWFSQWEGRKNHE